MASAVETQRLISVSLGKIARSRSQRGGINLHKNLLVASVLNRARTAFMMENYSYQIAQQQQQKQVTLQPTPVSSTASSSPATDAVNSLPTHVGETCSTTPDAESRSATLDTKAASSELVNGNETCPISSSCSVNVMDTDSELTCDKENISPSSPVDSAIPTSPVCEKSDEIVTELKQECVSGEQHIEAANQLSHDAQLAGTQPPVCQNGLSYITLSPCKQQSSATTTCAGVLKRRRVNLEAVQISSENECPASKKARTSSSESSSFTTWSQNAQHQRDPVTSSSCEYESDNLESDMQTSDSPQISNLVSIFNSGFSGLCNVSSSQSSSSSSSLEYDSSSSSCYQSDNSSALSHAHHQSWSNSDNQSLHCSSMVERIGSMSSAIVLSA